MKAPYGNAAASLAAALAAPKDARRAAGPEGDGRGGDLEDLPPEFREYVAYAGGVACLDAAMALLDVAGRRKPTVEDTEADQRFHGLLVIDSPSVERSGRGWVAALREALDKGWTVVQMLAPEDDPGRRVERVENLLSLVGRQHAYHPMVPGRSPVPTDPSRLQSMETIVVPGIGVLQLYPAGESASFFPWRDGFVDACRQIALAAHAVQAASVPLVTEYQAERTTPHRRDDAPEGEERKNVRLKAELLQLPAKIAFDTVLTEAVAQGGRRVAVKGGFVLSCMPANSTLEFAQRLKRRAAEVGMSASIPLLEMLTENRQRRRDAMRRFPSRDICTERGLGLYLDPKSPGPTRHQQHDVLTGELMFPDRIAHVNGVIELLQSSPHYEVALLPSPDLSPAPVEDSYWMATETALFYVGPLGDEGTRYVIIRDPAVVDAFFSLVDSRWDGFDAGLRDRSAVVARLQKIVAEAKEAHAMVEGRRIST